MWINVYCDICVRHVAFDGLNNLLGKIVRIYKAKIVVYYKVKLYESLRARASGTHFMKTFYNRLMLQDYIFNLFHCLLGKFSVHQNINSLLKDKSDRPNYVHGNTDRD